MATPDDLDNDEFADLDDEGDLGAIDDLDLDEGDDKDLDFDDDDGDDEKPLAPGDSDDDSDEDTEDDSDEDTDDSDDSDDDSDDDLDDEEPDDEEESLDVILAREQDLEDEFAPTGNNRSSDTSTPAGEGEFTCRSCFLVKRRAQLADADAMICFDCA